MTRHPITKADEARAHLASKDAALLAQGINPNGPYIIKHRRTCRQCGYDRSHRGVYSCLFCGCRFPK